MTPVLQVGNRIITAQEIIPLVAGYQLLPRLLFEIIIDEAIAPFTCTPEEAEVAYQQFCEKNQIAKDTERQAWLECNGMTLEQLQTAATRGLLIEKFKHLASIAVQPIRFNTSYKKATTTSLAACCRRCKLAFRQPEGTDFSKSCRVPQRPCQIKRQFYQEVQVTRNYWRLT